jgi:hypothetical protein
LLALLLLLLGRRSAHRHVASVVRDAVVGATAVVVAQGLVVTVVVSVDGGAGDGDKGVDGGVDFEDDLDIFDVGV